MTVLVFGANGSIGKVVVDHFLELGHDVVGVTTSDSQASFSERLKYHLISERAEDFLEVFRIHQPHVCINASGSPTVGFSYSHKAKDRYLNVSIPSMIVDAIEKRSRHTRFINFSSAAVYGNPASLPIEESTVIAPISPYGKHKAEAEEVLKSYARKGIKCVSFRIFSAYGIGMKKQLLWDLGKKCAAGADIHLFGTGEESRDFIQLEDIAAVCAAYSSHGAFDGSAINICSGEQTSIKTLAELFLMHYGIEKERLLFNMESRKGDPTNWQGDNSFLKKELSFQTMDFEEGIEAYVQWFKSNEEEAST